MNARNITYNGISGFEDEESREKVFYRDCHGHILIYTPSSGITGPCENIIPFWEIHDICDRGVSLDRIEAKCREVLEEKSKARVAEAARRGQQ
jgi:hypothetical protein